MSGDSPGQPAAATPPADMGAWERLKRRKVVQWTLAYVALAYGLVEAVDLVGHAFGWPAIIYRMVMVALAVGVPIAALLAWYHGERGQQRVSGPELTILTVLFVIAGSVLWLLARTTPEPSRVPAAATTSTSTPGPTAVADSPSPGATTPRASIAVLAFANLTGEPGKEYFSDGMAEELINALAGVPELKVPARTSSFAYKGRDTDTRRIAQDLGVSVVLEGSVRSAGERVRVTAQLIDGQSGYHLWSQSYDRDFGDLFVLQGDLANEIVNALGAYLKVDLPVTVEQRLPTRDLQAYELYLQANSLVGRLGASNLATAKELLRTATLRDPEFARAYSLAARAHLSSSIGGFSPSADELVHAEQAAQHSLSLDPGSGEARAILAQVHAFRGNWQLAQQNYQTALSLNPADPALQNLYSLFLLNMGHLEESVRRGREADRLAPATASFNIPVAVAYSLLGIDGEAVRYAQKAINLGVAADTPPLPIVFAHAAYRRDDFEEAATYMASALPSKLREQGATDLVRSVYAGLKEPGARPAAIEALGRLSALVEESDSSVMPMLLMTWYTMLGAIDDAYALATDVFENDHDSGGNERAVLGGLWAPEMRPFRTDPRFGALADSLNLTDYWRVYGSPASCELRDDELTCT